MVCFCVKFILIFNINPICNVKKQDVHVLESTMKYSVKKIIFFLQYFF